MTSSNRNFSIIGLVLLLPGRGGVRDRRQAHPAGARPRGRGRARLRGPADAAGPQVTPRRSTTRSRRSASARTRSACPSRRSSARAQNQISIGLPDVQNADARDRAGRYHGPAPVLRLGAERDRPRTDRRSRLEGLAEPPRGRGEAHRSPPKASEVSAPGSEEAPQGSDRRNDTTKGPLLPVQPRPRLPIGPDLRGAPAGTTSRPPARTCSGLSRPARRPRPKGSACRSS